MMRTAMIRCDASPDIGTGHFMRSFALAQALSPSFHVVFVSRSLSPEHILLLKRQNWEFCRIPSKISVPFEVRYLRALIKNRKVSLLIVDNHAYRMEHLRALKKETTLLDFDDFSNSSNPADIVYSPYALSGGRKKKKNRLNLFGVRHLTFSTELKKNRRRRPGRSEKNLRVIFSMGGSDHSNFTLKTLKCFGPHLKSHALIIGRGSFCNRDNVELKKFCDQNDFNVTWLKHPSHLWPEMGSSDLALVSGGLTKYEAAYLGVPSVTFARNSIEDIDCKHFERLGFGVHFGRPSALRSKKQLGRALALLRSRQLRKKMSANCWKMVPNGADKNVKNAILKFLRRRKQDVMGREQSI